MANKIQLYRAVQTFQHDGATYNPGDEFAQPPKWEVDAEFMKNLPPRAGKTTAFMFPVKVGTTVVGNSRVDDIDTRRILLPVEPA